MSFFEHYMGQSADAYLVARGGQVPPLEQVLADLTAQRPQRNDLLALAANELRQTLLDLSDPEARAFADLTAQMWQHPRRQGLIRATTALLAALGPAPTTPAEGATP